MSAQTMLSICSNTLICDYVHKKVNRLCLYGASVIILVMSHKAKMQRIGRRRWLLLLVALAALYVLLPQVGIFHKSFRVLSQAQLTYISWSTLFTFLTFVAAAGTYWLLARQRLRYPRTVLVQFASMFANRLLPAGIGGIGVNYAYLQKAKHSPTQAATVVTANNILGFFGHAILLIILLGIYGKHLPGLHLTTRIRHLELIEIVLTIIVISILIAARRFGTRILHALSSVLRQLVSYRHQPLRLTTALLSSMSLTMCNVLSLYFCVLALHIPISLITVLVVFTFGIAVGTATPTPGGIGGIEAGLVAGLVAYHASSANALAAVLAYRLISFWSTLAVGAIAFIFVERRGYF